MHQRENNFYFTSTVNMEESNRFIAEHSQSAMFGASSEVYGISSTTFANRNSEAFLSRQSSTKTPPIAIVRNATYDDDNDMICGDDMMIEKYIRSRSKIQYESDDESIDSDNTDEEKCSWCAVK